MAQLLEITMDSQNLGTDFPTYVNGTWAYSTSIKYQGTASVSAAFATVGTSLGSAIFTANLTIYTRFALRFNRTAIPSVLTEIAVMTWHDTADNNVVYLDVLVQPTTGDLSLRLINNVVFEVIASAAIANDTWIVVDVKIVQSDTVGILELRVNDSVIATGINKDTLQPTTTGIMFVELVASRGTTLNGLTGTVYFDHIIVDNAVYPSYLTWDQEGYRWRNDNGNETDPTLLTGGATYIAAKNTPP